MSTTWMPCLSAAAVVFSTEMTPHCNEVSAAETDEPVVMGIVINFHGRNQMDFPRKTTALFDQVLKLYVLLQKHQPRQPSLPDEIRDVMRDAAATPKLLPEATDRALKAAELACKTLSGNTSMIAAQARRVRGCLDADLKAWLHEERCDPTVTSPKIEVLLSTIKEASEKMKPQQKQVAMAQFYLKDVGSHAHFAQTVKEHINAYKPLPAVVVKRMNKLTEEMEDERADVVDCLIRCLALVEMAGHYAQVRPFDQWAFSSTELEHYLELMYNEADIPMWGGEIEAALRTIAERRLARRGQPTNDGKVQAEMNELSNRPFDHLRQWCLNTSICDRLQGIVPGKTSTLLKSMKPRCGDRGEMFRFELTIVDAWVNANGDAIKRKPELVHLWEAFKTVRLSITSDYPSLRTVWKLRTTAYPLMRQFGVTSEDLSWEKVIRQRLAYVPHIRQEDLRSIIPTCLELEISALTSAAKCLPQGAAANEINARVKILQRALAENLPTRDKADFNTAQALLVGGLQSVSAAHVRWKTWRSISSRISLLEKGLAAIDRNLLGSHLSRWKGATDEDAGSLRGMKELQDFFMELLEEAQHLATASTRIRTALNGMQVFVRAGIFVPSCTEPHLEALRCMVDALSSHTPAEAGELGTRQQQEAVETLVEVFQCDEQKAIARKLALARIGTSEFDRVLSRARSQFTNKTAGIQAALEKCRTAQNFESLILAVAALGVAARGK